MVHHHLFKAFDSTLRDVAGRDEPFGQVPGGRPGQRLQSATVCHQVRQADRSLCERSRLGGWRLSAPVTAVAPLCRGSAAHQQARA